MTTARIANVAGAVVPGGAGGPAEPFQDAAVVAAADPLDALFVETLRAGDAGFVGTHSPGRSVSSPTSPFGALFALFVQTDAERVLVVEPTGAQPDPEELLALTCWPEADALVFEEAGRRYALYRREAALEAFRQAADVDALLSALDAERLDRDGLGLGDVAEVC